MKVVILCGGLGTRMREQTELVPKPMLDIGGRPILWHIMKIYAAQGFKEFVLCLGHKSDVIKRYFLDYRHLVSDFTLDLADGSVESHIPPAPLEDWKVTFVETGPDAMTGARVKRVEPYVTGDRFMVTYGDAVSDIDVRALLAFHASHGKVGTVTGVAPPSRYGELAIENAQVVGFAEKPAASSMQISGGYFVFNRAFFDYLDSGDACVLEHEPLERLTKEGQLRVYQHAGFWQCMDTPRDYNYLQSLWNDAPPWKLWDG